MKKSEEPLNILEERTEKVVGIIIEKLLGDPQVLKQSIDTCQKQVEQQAVDIRQLRDNHEALTANLDSGREEIVKVMKSELKKLDEIVGTGNTNVAESVATLKEEVERGAGRVEKSVGSMKESGEVIKNMLEKSETDFQPRLMKKLNDLETHQQLLNDLFEKRVKRFGLWVRLATVIMMLNFILLAVVLIVEFAIMHG